MFTHWPGLERIRVSTTIVCRECIELHVCPTLLDTKLAYQFLQTNFWTPSTWNVYTISKGKGGRHLQKYLRYNALAPQTIWGAKETQVRRGLKCKEACMGWKVAWCTVGTKEPDEDVSAEWQTIPSQTRRFLQWLRWLTRDCRDGQLWEIEIMCCGRFLTQCFFVLYSNIYIAPLIARSHREALLSAISS